MLSDRIGSRKQVLLIAGVVATLGIALLGLFQGGAVWAAVVLAGMMRDGFMSVVFTMAVLTRGVNLSYATTATGFIMIFNGVGNVLAPPAGNAMAAVSPGAPFLFWAGMSVLGVVGIALISAQYARPATPRD